MQARTVEKPRLDDCCLENFWGDCLTRYGWSHRAIKQSWLALATSTRQSYNRVLARCKQFCDNIQCQFPPSETKHLADFLCSLSDSSARPSSILHTALAALSHAYLALDMSDITKDVHVSRLVTGLVKSQTEVPMRKSSVLPVEKFINLFLTWGANSTLSIKQLRLKAITLLSIALMLRPSDIAPKATLFESGSKTVHPMRFTTDMLCFTPEGVKVTFMGIKNDTQRTGFEVYLPRHDNALLDPVKALEDYIASTSNVRTDQSVFLSLKHPFSAISAASVAKVLEESIGFAGLSGQGFTAKSFRPTWATVAIGNGFDPHVVQKLGRWKSADVFYQHYVHSQTPATFVTKVLPEPGTVL